MNLKVLFLILVMFFMMGFLAPQKKTVYVGKITSEAANVEQLIGTIIEFRIDTLVIATSVIGLDGEFEIHVKTIQDCDVFYNGLGIGEAYIQTIKPSEKDTVFLSFKIPNKYNKKLGKVICPKCAKQDQTIPVRYGLNSGVVIQHTDKKGNIIELPYDDKNYYAGTCITSEFHPKWYCKRDKIKF